MKYAFICAISAYCLLSASIAAADGPAAGAAGGPRWTGFSIGVGAGLKAMNTEVSAVPGEAVSNDPGAIGAHVSLDGLGAEGSFASVGVGADYQFHERFVVGAFFDYDFGSVDTKVDVNIPGIPLLAHGEVEMKNAWSIGGRLGYLPTPTTLIFLSAGYTRVETTDISADISGPFEASARANVSSIAGVFYGGGVETMLTERISLKGEYRYTDFGSGDVTLPTVEGLNLNVFVSPSLEPSLHTGRVSLAYHF
jgi:outer membrane immunogenic protein